MEETEITSFKLLPITISLESESIEQNQVRDHFVPHQTGLLSTGEPSLVMEESSMELKKEEMEDHLRLLLDPDNLSTASILHSQNYTKEITLLSTAQLTMLMVVPEPYPQSMISKFLSGLILNSRLKWSNVTSPHIKLIKQLFTLLNTLPLFNHIDASFSDLIMNKVLEPWISF